MARGEANSLAAQPRTGSAAGISTFPRRFGSYIRCPSEPVAQSVEHVTFNHGVVGSNPAGLANKTKDLSQSSLVS